MSDQLAATGERTDFPAACAEVNDTDLRNAARVTAVLSGSRWPMTQAVPGWNVLMPIPGPRSTDYVRALLADVGT